MTEPADNLIDFVDRVYWPRRALKNTPRTRELIGYTLAHFERFLKRRATLSDLNDDMVCAFLAWRLAEVKRPATADKDWRTLRPIWNFAARKRFVAEFPDVDNIAVPKATPEAWSESQIAALLAACRNTVGTLGKAQARDWWMGFHYVALFTGERTEALLRLEWPMLGAGGWLRVPAAIRKGRRKPMDYQLPEPALHYVDRLRGRTEPFIFEMPWKWGKNGKVPASFYLQYTSLLKRAGLPTGRGCKPQRIRRTFATFLELGGGNATEALGHESRKTTKESYLDPTILGGVTPGQTLSGVYKF